MQSCAEYTFPKENRLRKRHQYQQTWLNGRKLRTKNFLIVVCRRGSACACRVGITVSRKVGGAVVRNRVKRMIREYVRIHYRRLPTAADISIIARPGTAVLSSSQLHAELDILLMIGVVASHPED
ncbi:MAG: ribonuclease P protein component [Desulfuromonadaceae bacterium]|nr:ribonuclease P protein component [Desulfuromonadaceae bacterium]